MLEYWYSRVELEQDKPVWNEPISTDLEFLERLTFLDLEYLAGALSKQCHAIYRRVVPDNFRKKETKLSYELVDWFATLKARGSECFAARLESRVAFLAKVCTDDYKSA